MSMELLDFLCSDTQETRGGHKHIYFTRFWGGNDKGNCIQITIGTQYVQLTNDQFQELISEQALCWKEL